MENDINKILATHCAPLLYKLKPASLVSGNLLNGETEKNLLEIYDVSIRVVNNKPNPLLLLYNKKLLSISLANKKANTYLALLGYPTKENIESKIDFLCERFSQSDEFPHEIGFFLGYPPDDVIGFITSKKDYKMSGLWKVYGDIEVASSLFAKYEQCRQVLMEYIGSGGNIFNDSLPALSY